MAEQALYVPHSLGTVIGSRQHRPWLARDAHSAIEQTTTTPWRGQPAFPTAPDAFAWLEWARDQEWLPDGLAVAHIDAHTDLTAEGIHRIHAGPAQLCDATNQVVRPHPGAAGPDPHVLAACHGLARADAMRTWMLNTVGATAREQRHAALSTVWAYGYQIAGRDGRTVLADQIARAVRAILADPRGGATNADGVAELRRLDQAAATIGAGAAIVAAADLPDNVFAQAATAEIDAGHVRGWDAAIAMVWKEALRLGALHGAMGAGVDIRGLWRAEPHGQATPATRVQARPADDWFNDLVLDANRSFATRWLLATAQPLHPPPPQPQAAVAPVVPQPSTLATSHGLPTGNTGQTSAGRAFTSTTTTPPATAGQASASAAPPQPPRDGRRR